MIIILYACFTTQPHTSELLVYVICNKDLELPKRCTSLALLSLIQHHNHKPKPHIHLFISLSQTTSHSIYKLFLGSFDHSPQTSARRASSVPITQTYTFLFIAISYSTKDFQPTLQTYPQMSNFPEHH